MEFATVIAFFSGYGVAFLTFVAIITLDKFEREGKK